MKYLQVGSLAETKKDCLARPLHRRAGPFSRYRACIQRNRFAEAVALDSNFLSWPIICAPTSDSYLGLGRQMAARMGLAF